MSICLFELKRNRIAFAVFGGIISFMLAVCIVIYPEMQGQMAQMNDLFADMGAFTDAFGMDELSFNTLIGYYGIECGNVLGIGGALFAAFLGIRILSGEEGSHTAEFLLTHPLRRSRVIVQKLTAVLAQIVGLNLLVLLVSMGAFLLIGEAIPLKEVLLLHLAYLFLQIEIGLLTFGLSGLIRKSGAPLGMGLAMLLYFFNILGNIAKEAEFLRYITPFAYTNASDVVTSLSLDTGLILLGLFYGVLATLAGSLYYTKKDIYA